MTQTLRTLFWVVTAVAVAIFAMWNWDEVIVRLLPNGAVEKPLVKAPLAMVILGSYLMGMLPLWLVYRASKWNLTRRLNNAEQQLNDLRAKHDQLKATTPTNDPAFAPATGPLSNPNATVPPLA